EPPDMAFSSSVDGHWSMPRSVGIGTCSRSLRVAHVLVGEPVPTRPEYALTASLRLGAAPDGGFRHGGPRRKTDDRFRRAHLAHQVVAPCALHLEVGDGAELDGLDHVVVHVPINPRLEELVQRGAGRAAADEPRLDVGL